MWKNYFKVALRNLYRYKGFSLINILGLAIGITGCLLIGLFVWDEWQYDKFVKGGNSIYRIYAKSTNENGTTFTGNTPPAFAPYLQQNYPEVVQTTRLMMWSGRMLMEVGEKLGYEDKGLVADSTFFDMFPLQMVKGDARTALDQPASVVLTEEIATKYFGTTDPINKTITLDKSDFIVKGVLAKIPEHFHLDINYVLPLSAAGIPADRINRWTWQQFFTYVKVKEGTNIAQLQNKFFEASAKERKAESEGDATEEIYEPLFQPLTNIHLHSSNFQYDNAKRGNATYVKGLTIIAIFVLLIACFNFINLATARSFRRAKEIGVRKVIGADRKQLILQFTGETILVSLIANLIAVIATILILPYLNTFTGKAISFNPITNPLLLLLMFGIAVGIGILSGLYPAMVMSGYQPIKVLKGLKPTGNDGNANAALRQGLVIVQFALSALLIICTVIVYRQMNYLHQKDLGFNKDQIVYFNAQGRITENPQAFKEELKRSTGIVSVTAGYGLPGDALATDGVKLPGPGGDKHHSTVLLIADEDYIKTMGAQLIAGRDFSKSFATDVEEAFIINETAVKELGFGTPQAAIGKKLHWDKWVPDSLNPVKKGQVVGVVKDFHVKSLHEKINSTVMIMYPPVISKVAVKVKAANLPATIAFIKAAWNKFSPEYPLDYKFLDENFAAMYKSEDKLSTLLWIFTIMAIFVGCMGLFGLAAFSAEQRVKEIGIRKVLGASVMNIVSMLSLTFLKPVLIASLIAFPIAWWAMNSWLQDFEYRVSISWWVFVLAGLAALVIALVTVSFQSIKAATVNPVKNLRTE